MSAKTNVSGDTLCPRCGASMQATHHQLCAVIDGDLPDDVVIAGIRLHEVVGEARLTDFQLRTLVFILNTSFIRDKVLADTLEDWISFQAAQPAR